MTVRQCLRNWPVIRLLKDGPVDAIRLSRFSIGFAPSPSEVLSRLILPRGEFGHSADQPLDDIFLWWVLDGFHMKRWLFRLGLEPRPPDEDEGSAWDIEPAIAATPPIEFAQLVDVWLAQRWGRRLWTSIDKDVRLFDSIIAVEKHMLKIAAADLTAPKS